nr:hypothetical protein [Leptospira interrogans]
MIKKITLLLSLSMGLILGCITTKEREALQKYMELIEEGTIDGTFQLSEVLPQNKKQIKQKVINYYKEFNSIDQSNEESCLASYEVKELDYDEFIAVFCVNQLEVLTRIYDKPHYESMEGRFHTAGFIYKITFENKKLNLKLFDTKIRSDYSDISHEFSLKGRKNIVAASQIFFENSEAIEYKYDVVKAEQYARFHFDNLIAHLKKSESEVLTKERMEQFVNYRVSEKTNLSDKVLKEKIIKYYTEFNTSFHSEQERCEIPSFKIDKKDKEDLIFWKNKTPVWCDIKMVDGRDLHTKKARILFHIIRNPNEYSIKVAMVYIPNIFEDGEEYYLRYIPEIEQVEEIARKHFQKLVAYLKK